jgi:hypothetical protein
MLQVMLRVGTSRKGSIQAVLGSGTMYMSDSLIAFQPRILDPSKGSPSVKVSSLIIEVWKETCCQVPKISTNLRSTIWTLLSWII